MEFQHGGDIYSYEARFGRDTALDFSANINPRGMPEPVLEAMQAAIVRCTQYPDPFCHALREELAKRWTLPRDRFFCGNGAAEVFFRLADCLQPQKALLLAPTFGEYEAALVRTGCALRFHTLRAEDGFAVTERLLEEITEELDAVFLCNPNNPTGQTIDPVLLNRIADACRDRDIWLVADECFADFLLQEEHYTLRHRLADCPQLVIVRAFTKIYAMPGARLGWCMAADAALIERLYAAGQPWNVSTIAQAGGIAALQLPDYAAETARLVAGWREELRRGLQELGLRVFHSDVNFLLLCGPEELYEKLLPCGIILRDCANYRGLCKGYFRTAVRTEAENEMLIRRVREVVEDG